MQLVRRNWGHYLVLFDRKYFKVKLLRFRQFGELSYQWHRYRSELWLFLKGKGRIQMNNRIINRDEELNGKFFCFKNKVKHKYTAWETTWVLEIQYGFKCDEEDIVRLSE